MMLRRWKTPVHCDRTALVPASVAGAISQRLTIPTIGIGSGPLCDGEIQVFHDLFGLFTDFMPRHTDRYLNLSHDITEAARRYMNDVSARSFPGPGQTSDLKPESKIRFETLLDTLAPRCTLPAG